LKEHEAAVSVADLCRKYGGSDTERPLFAACDQRHLEKRSRLAAASPGHFL
jgi:hypothetical protein